MAAEHAGCTRRDRVFSLPLLRVQARAVGAGSASVQLLVAAQVLPGPVSEGVLGDDVMALPHRWRMLSAMARQWRAQHGGTNGPE